MLLRRYLLLIRFVAVIMISILASLFWNTLYIQLEHCHADDRSPLEKHFANTSSNFYRVVKNCEIRPKFIL